MESPRELFSDESLPEGWVVSVETDTQVDVLRQEPLDGEEQGRSLMVLDGATPALSVKCLAGYGPDGCPKLARMVDGERAVRLVHAEIRAIEMGYPTAVDVEDDSDEAADDSPEPTDDTDAGTEATDDSPNTTGGTNETDETSETSESDQSEESSNPGESGSGSDQPTASADHDLTDFF